jgi:glycerol-3-phosphate responsive antiterminator
MISLSIQQASTILLLIEDDLKRVMLLLSESEDYKETNRLMEKRKKLNAIHDDLTYKISNIEVEIV